MGFKFPPNHNYYFNKIKNNNENNNLNNINDNNIDDNNENNNINNDNNLNNNINNNNLNNNNNNEENNLNLLMKNSPFYSDDLCDLIDKLLINFQFNSFEEVKKHSFFLTPNNIPIIIKNNINNINNNTENNIINENIINNNENNIENNFNNNINNNENNEINENNINNENNNENNKSNENNIIVNNKENYIKDEFDDIQNNNNNINNISLNNFRKLLDKYRGEWFSCRKKKKSITLERNSSPSSLSSFSSISHNLNNNINNNNNNNLNKKNENLISTSEKNYHKNLMINFFGRNKILLAASSITPLRYFIQYLLERTEIVPHNNYCDYDKNNLFNNNNNNNNINNNNNLNNNSNNNLNNLNNINNDNNNSKGSIDINYLNNLMNNSSNLNSIQTSFNYNIDYKFQYTNTNLINNIYNVINNLHNIIINPKNNNQFFNLNNEIPYSFSIKYLGEQYYMKIDSSNIKTKPSLITHCSFIIYFINTSELTMNNIRLFNQYFNSFSISTKIIFICLLSQNCSFNSVNLIEKYFEFMDRFYSVILLKDFETITPNFFSIVLLKIEELNKKIIANNNNNILINKLHNSLNSALNRLKDSKILQLESNSNIIYSFDNKEIIQLCNFMDNHLNNNFFTKIKLFSFQFDKKIFKNFGNYQFIHSIYLIKCNINDKDLIFITKLFAKYPNIENLSLEENNFTIIGLKYFFYSLPLLKKIKFLDLSYNNIGDYAVKLLSKSLIINSTLSSLFLRNINMTELLLFSFLFIYFLLFFIFLLFIIIIIFYYHFTYSFIYFIFIYIFYSLLIFYIIYYSLL